MHLNNIKGVLVILLTRVETVFGEPRIETPNSNPNDNKIKLRLLRL